MITKYDQLTPRAGAVAPAPKVILPAGGFDDGVRLVSKADIQYLFEVDPQQLKGWMEEADVNLRCPFVALGERAPRFEVRKFAAWLVWRFGQGNWAAGEGQGGSGDRCPSGTGDRSQESGAKN